MTDLRMTDERLAEIEADHLLDWFTCKELLQALKAERDDNAVLRRVNKNHLERISELEQQLAELEAKLERVRRLPAEWRDAWEMELRMAADDLEEALADDE